MILTFLFVGADRVSWLQDFEAEYLEKIQRYHRSEVVRLKPSRDERANSELKKKNETDLLLSRIKDSDFLVVFDERGEALGSLPFSKKMESWFNRGKSRLVFCVGGAFGFDDRLRARADVTISLSGFVLNHHVAQAVVLEQIYRAISIQKNLPYHNV